MKRPISMRLGVDELKSLIDGLNRSVQHTLGEADKIIVQGKPAVHLETYFSVLADQRALGDRLRAKLPPEKRRTK